MLPRDARAVEVRAIHTVDRTQSGDLRQDRDLSTRRRHFTVRRREGRPRALIDLVVFDALEARAVPELVRTDDARGLGLELIVLAVFRIP